MSGDQGKTGCGVMRDCYSHVERFAVMPRIIVTLLFVIAVAAQSASLRVDADGIRPAMFAAQANAWLGDFADCDDDDQTIAARITLATGSLERFIPLARRQQQNRAEKFALDNSPLYLLHAVWRI